MKEKPALYYITLFVVLALIFFCVILPGVVRHSTGTFPVMLIVIRIGVVIGILIVATVFFSTLKNSPAWVNPIAVVFLLIAILCMVAYAVIAYIGAGLT